MPNDLARHLHAGAQHHSLAFHRDCSECRAERLLGRPTSPLAARRLGLGLATLALVATPIASAGAAVPPPLVAPDQETEGSPDADSNTLDDPDPLGIDPEGEDTGDAETGDPELNDENSDEGAGPVEAPAAPESVDPAEVQADAPDPAVPPSGGDLPATPPSPPIRPQEVPPLAGSPQSPLPDLGPLSPIARDQRQRTRGKDAKPKQPNERRKQTNRLGHTNHPPAKVGAGWREPSTPLEPARPKDETAESSGAVAQDRAGPAESGPTQAPESTHVIARGETLWSIARDRLGGRRGPGAIAREVQRLWDLNADRIGTGSPDLIMPGQTLLLL